MCWGLYNDDAIFLFVSPQKKQNSYFANVSTMKHEKGVELINMQLKQSLSI